MLRHGRKRTKSYIPLGRLILDILMDNKLIDSLTNYQFTKGMKPTSGKWLDNNGLKNMKIINELISPPVEVSKEEIRNIRIPLNDFPIFSRPYSMDNVVKFLEKCHADVILEAYEATFRKKKKRKIKAKRS